MLGGATPGGEEVNTLGSELALDNCNFARAAPGRFVSAPTPHPVVASVTEEVLLSCVFFSISVASRHRHRRRLLLTELAHS